MRTRARMQKRTHTHTHPPYIGKKQGEARFNEDTSKNAFKNTKTILIFINKTHKCINSFRCNVCRLRQ